MAGDSREDRRRRARAIVRGLKKLYPDAHCALNHRSAYELLVATILSAQCTDARVNQVTPELFRKYPSPKQLRASNERDLQRVIRSTGFFRNKARNLKGAGAVIVERFGGRIPSTMGDLLELPGVARKTANVILGTWYGKAEGVVVDTHVQRITGRLELSASQDPKAIEADLMKLLPRQEWIQFSHRVISHGRTVCVARRPKCSECGISEWCPSAGTFTSSTAMRLASSEFHVEQGRLA